MMNQKKNCKKMKQMMQMTADKSKHDPDRLPYLEHTKKYFPLRDIKTPVETYRGEISDMYGNRSPLPIMPSSTFIDLATSQFELLAHSLKVEPINGSKDKRSKIKSIALYLPQENELTGQLEFLPALVYPRSDRIFIASNSADIPPTIPQTLTQLPGFTHASTLMPTYPFASSAKEGRYVGVCEEVFCDLKSGKGSSTALSLPLFSGPQTIGILLVWGADVAFPQAAGWTIEEKEQIQRAGETLALALAMDSERYQNQIRVNEFRVAMADSLHQVKNPVQALRTFAKILQRNLATDEITKRVQLSRLAEDIVTQSDRVVDLLSPMDSMIDAIAQSNDLNSYQKLLMPMQSKGIVLRSETNDRKKVRDELPLSRLDSLPEKSKQDKDTRMEMSFVPDVLRDIFSAEKALAIENGVHLIIFGADDDGELPGVTINPRHLQEAVANVLDNAIKYVSLGKDGVFGVKNDEPIVRVILSENSDDLPPGVTILIEDNGPGIAQDDRRDLFRRGFRGKYTSQIKGSGIGLDISRELMRNMGGTLELVPNDPRIHFLGTVMKFTLFRVPCH
jgi:signal transduction histidine kinase